MPRIFLTNETYIAANDGSEIIGSAGTEQVVLQTGVTQASIASNIERLDLPGDIAEYSFSSFGAALTVSTPAGDVVATVSDAGGKQLGFADGVQDLTFDPDSFTLSLGGVPLDATPSPVDPDAAPPPDAGSYVSGQGGNGVVSDFNIEVIFDSVFTTDQRDAFELAADYLSSLITSDLPDEGGIDDIRITAVLEPIDGEFEVVGSAGPDALRPGSLLPYEGGMTFDTADVDRKLTDGTFVDTVAHEMLHALGFGTLWEDTFLDLLSGDTDLRFTGDNAIAAYNAEFPDIAGADANSATGVPVETDGGEGTAGGHWDEDIFTNEVMTGYGMAGIDDYTSGMTVAALEDMGYDTVFDVGLPGATMPQLDDFVMA